MVAISPETKSAAFAQTTVGKLRYITNIAGSLGFDGFQRNFLEEATLNLTDLPDSQPITLILSPDGEFVDIRITVK